MKMISLFKSYIHSHFLFLISILGLVGQLVGRPLQFSLSSDFWIVFLYLDRWPFPHEVDQADHDSYLHSTYLQRPEKRRTATCSS